MNQVEKKVMLQISRILKLYLCLSFIYLPLNYYSLRGNNQFFMLNIRSFGIGVHLNRNNQGMAMKLLANIVVIVLNYILSKLVVFKKQGK